MLNVGIKCMFSFKRKPRSQNTVATVSYEQLIKSDKILNVKAKFFINYSLRKHFLKMFNTVSFVFRVLNILKI